MKPHISKSFQQPSNSEWGHSWTGSRRGEFFTAMRLMLTSIRGRFDSQVKSRWFLHKRCQCGSIEATSAEEPWSAMSGSRRLPIVLICNTGFTFALIAVPSQSFVLIRRHFDRITVSLGDHNVQVYDDTKNVFRLEGFRWIWIHFHLAGSWRGLWGRLNMTTTLSMETWHCCSLRRRYCDILWIILGPAVAL